MQKLLWQHIIIWDHSSAVTGEVGTESNTTGAQLHLAPQHTQLLKRFAEHTHLCEVSISLDHAWSSLKGSSDHYCYNKKFYSSQCKCRDRDLWLRSLI